MSVPTSISNIDILTADRASAIGSIGDVRDYVQRATVKGRLMQGETLTVDLVAGANTFDAVKELQYGQVLDISTWTNQYFIQKIRRNYPDVGGLQIEARAYYERLKYSRCKRTYSETKRVDRVFSIYAQTPEEALDTIMGSAPSGLIAGSVSTLTTDQKAAEITISLEDDTHWAAIEKLCSAIQAKTGVGCEFYFTRSGDDYQVNLVQQVGISGNRSVKAGGGSAGSPSNRLNLQRTTHGDNYFSRLSAKMGDSAENITLGRDFDGRPIHWLVQTATPGSPAAGRTTLTLSGEPIPYDDWGTSEGDDSPHYFGNEAQGFFQIGDSTYPNTIVLQTGTTEIEDGYFASDSQGTALDYIRASDVEGDYGVVEKSADIQGVPVPNLIRRGGDSDDMETFVAGVPDGWIKVGGATTVAQVTDERYAEVGTKSCQVQATINGGLRSGFYTVRGGLVSALARLSVEAGEVQIRMIDEDGNHFPGPDEGQAVSSSRALQAISLGVWNTFESRVAIEILATKPDTVFYIDAVTLTPSNGSYDWASVMGGREMWAETGRLLALDGGTIWSELSGTSIDLSEITGFGSFDAFELGALVTIQDGYSEGVHDVNFSTRVIEFSKPIIGMAPEATWTAEKVREDFIDYLRAGKPIRPRPVPQTPTTPRYPPRLAVEREAVADADGGGNPGVTFTLFPKTSKNENLENWEIFVSVDGAAFSSIGTDETSLSPDASSAYYIGGGYATVLGTTAQPTYSVVYPPDDGSVTSVRFYVVARSTGLASEPVEYLVRNPEIAAGQITGTLIAEQLGEAAQSYGKTFAFSSVDADTVAWGAGTLTFANGTGYSINAANTGDMVFGSIYYIYFDPDTSTTELQVSTTNADAVGSRKALLAVAQKSLVSASAFFQDAVGVLSLTNEQLAVDSVDTNQLRANSITGVKIQAAAIDTLHIAANAVTTAEINFVPLISTSTTGAIVGTINASAEGIDIDAQFISIGGTTTFTTGYDPTQRADVQRATAAPSTRADGSTLRAGDLWIETDQDDQVYSWSGSAWGLTKEYADAADLNVTILDNSSPSTRADGSSLQQGDLWLDTSNGRKPYSWSGAAWLAAYTVIDGGNITTGTINASVVAVTNLNASNITTGTLAAARVTIGSGSTYEAGYDPTSNRSVILDNSSPSTRTDGSALVAGDMWLDTANGRKPYSWSGAAWLAAYTIIDGGSITTGTINASVVTVSNLNASNISTGTLSADRIGASSITAAKLSVTTLASITSSTGSLSVTGSLELTASGTIDLGTSGGNLVAGNYLTIAANTVTIGSLGELNCDGDINFASLPTSDPSVAGRLWRDGATVKVSL